MNRAEFRWVVLALPLLLSGCFLFSSGPSSEVIKTSEEMKTARMYVPPIYDVFAYGPVAEISPGAWGRYRVTEKGNSYEVTLAVVGRSSKGTWVEVIEEGDVRHVSLRLISADQRVIQAFYREVPKGKAPGPVWPQEISHGGVKSGSKLKEVDRTEETGETQIKGQSIPILTVEVELEDFDGRVETEEFIWSKKVPALFAGDNAGGLVRKKSALQVVDLLEFGERYKPVSQIPK